MKQIIQKNQLQLKQKGEKILCQKHKESIIQLNICANQQLNDRLICSSCQISGKSLLLLSQAENIIYGWYKEEQETINKKYQEVNDNINKIQIETSEIQKKLENVIHQTTSEQNEGEEQIPQRLQSLSELILDNQKEQNQIIEQYSNTKLQEFISKIANCEVIDEQTLQQIAEYISNQEIMDEKLMLLDQFKIPDQIIKQIHQSYDKIYSQLHSINTVLNNLIQQQLEQQKQSSQTVESYQQETLDYDTFKYKDPIQLEGHKGSIGAVAMSNNDQLMASGDWNGEIILWNLSSRQIKQKYNGETQILDLIFSFDNKLLVAANNYPPYHILIFNLSIISSTSPYIRLKGHTHITYRIALTSNSEYLISGSADMTLRIWKLDQKEYIFCEKLSSYVYGVSISQNQKYISACCGYGQAHLFDSSDIQRIKELTNWRADNTAACGTTFTPDSKMLLTCGFGFIRLWSIDELLSNGKQKTPQKVYKVNDDSYFWTVSIRMNGSKLITNDGQIRIMNIENGELIQSLKPPDRYVVLFDQRSSVSQDMKYIVTGGNNTLLKLYELQTKQMQKI